MEANIASTSSSTNSPASDPSAHSTSLSRYTFEKNHTRSRSRSTTAITRNSKTSNTTSTTTAALSNTTVDSTVKTQKTRTKTRTHSLLAWIPAMAVFSSRNSGTYERLEGGGVGGPRGPKQRLFGWKKFMLGAAAIIAIVVLFGPRQTRQLPWKSHNEDPLPQEDEKSPYEYERPPTTGTKPDTHVSKPPPPTVPTKPTSFETDPDPAKTVFCDKPHNPDVPLVQYALMIDAGSTGSRIHAYKFNNCKVQPQYEYETFKMTIPGLSSFANNPEDAAKSLDVLMKEAVRVVPEHLRKCTPVAVKATAGLRLLPQSQSDAILKAVEKRLEEEYPFKLHGGVEIMDGKDEGVYAWITANYLLDNFSKGDTLAVLDLGGASTQIVFEPTFADKESKMVEGEHKYELKFGGKKYELYQHSYLGYGLMRARMSVHKLVNFLTSIRAKEGKGNIVGNPCLARGTQRVVSVTDDSTGAVSNVTMSGEDIGGFESCNRVIELVMAKDAICEVKPCSFDGVYQPTLMDTFANGKVLLLSYFYDRVAPLIPEDASITVASIADLAKKVCRGSSSWESHWGHNEEVIEELKGRPEWCLDLTFMHGLLRLGYEFEGERQVRIGKRIDGTELGWALGATISMVLGGELTCRV